ncbi:MAG: amino acid ABC transporter substrate-binding protein [Alphaproteobacteria bacterium]|nr:amino acid ABC transporter substrate-binding protein [Alphaproteobacteria bacterium]
MKTLSRSLAAGLAAAAFTTIAASTIASGATLDTVRERGFVNCGVGENFPGFFAPDASGKWSGLDVDFCRALSAAVFAAPDKVKYLPATPAARFAQLQSGQVDLLSRSVTWTMSRDAGLGLGFAGVTFFDGQGFMVRKALGAKSAKDLDGATVCTQTGTTTELNLADYFRANGLKYTPVVFETTDQVIAAYEAQRCDVYTTDKSTLAARLTKLKDPAAHMVLPETISKAANGPVVRQGDGQWANIVRWTLNALIAAEELGITSANVEQVRSTTKDPEARRLLGADGELGKLMGLDKAWAYNVIKSVGNYGELYERNLGPKGAVPIPRDGLNRLWSKGGLLFAPSFQ